MMSMLMKNNNILRLFSLSILMCDLYMEYKIIPEFRTKVRDDPQTYTWMRVIHE